MDNRQPLYETYRPQTWADVVGQTRALDRLTIMRQRGGFGGRSFWISGESGTGKTTIARLIAAELASDLAIWELDAGALTVQRLREIEADWRTGTFGKGGRAYIVNEAHGLRRDAIRQLLVMLERVPGHCVVIFTTTNDGQEGLFDDVADAGPLTSRCVILALSTIVCRQPFARRAREIAEREGLGGAPESEYAAFGERCKWNMRAMLQAVESGEFLATNPAA